MRVGHKLKERMTRWLPKMVREYLQWLATLAGAITAAMLGAPIHRNRFHRIKKPILAVILKEKTS